MYSICSRQLNGRLHHVIPALQGITHLKLLEEFPMETQRIRYENFTEDIKQWQLLQEIYIT